jgi:hypothetical protein
MEEVIYNIHNNELVTLIYKVFLWINEVILIYKI